MATAAQKAAQKKFKAAITEAKKIRKDNPNKKWNVCVKEGFKKVK